MNTIIVLCLGILIGFIFSSLFLIQVINSQYQITKYYKEANKKHNYRELRLLFINQSIKDYVTEQQNIIKKYSIKNLDDIGGEDYFFTGRYIAFKDIEKTITQLEKNSEDLCKKE